MREWMIPDCFWPEKDQGDYVSHEAICILNPHPHDVTVSLRLYYEDREKVVPAPMIIPAERTRHIRMDHVLLPDGAHIARGIPYAAVIACDDEISVQYTRVDTTQPALTIATTII